MMSRSLAAVAAAFLLLPPCLAAQAPTLTCDREREGDRPRFCEIREVTFDARHPVAIDGGPNGGVRVQGWDRSDIRLVARVETWASSDERARELAADVKVDHAGTIRSTGPDSRGREGWAVSFEAFVPRRSDLEIETLNGGIRITDVHGRIRFEVTNGGVMLAGLGGDVSGHSTNGGISLQLAGATWDGTGVDVRTSNGGVRITVPEGYAARLETGTTNGGLQFEFPVTVQGRLNRRVEVDLGGGGPTVRAVTTNGGVVVRRPEI